MSYVTLNKKTNLEQQLEMAGITYQELQDRQSVLYMYQEFKGTLIHRWAARLSKYNWFETVSIILYFCVGILYIFGMSSNNWFIMSAMIACFLFLWVLRRVVATYSIPPWLDFEVSGFIAGTYDKQVALLGEELLRKEKELKDLLAEVERVKKLEDRINARFKQRDDTIFYAFGKDVYFFLSPEAMGH